MSHSQTHSITKSQPAFSPSSLLRLLLLACWLGFQGHASAQYTETILHSFGDGSVTNDVQTPTTGLVQASDGNFYGTAFTENSGSAYGTVYKVTPSGTVTPLRVFGTFDGSPVGSLIQATDGYLYGAADGGWGYLFKLHLDGTLFSVATTFGAPPGPSSPHAKLIQGIDGNLYGTLAFGGSYIGGIVFSFNRSTGAMTILHEFGNGTDGAAPFTGLVQDAGGNFYGTTIGGGSAGNGTVFKMTPSGTVTVLHNFGDGTVTNDGSTVKEELILGSDGNLYGTTQGGGSAAAGTVFKITSLGTSSPIYSILHNFQDGSVTNDGFGPLSGLIQLPDGNFYGTTTFGGSTSGPGFAGNGAFYKITPSGTVTILHSFGDGSVTNDGIFPFASLFQGNDGSLYGTTQFGGSANLGTIFKFSLPSAPVILSANSATFAVGLAGSFTITAFGNPTPVLSATGLPTWATLDASTGVISGTPPDTNGAPFIVTVTASNGNSPDASQNLTINVLPGPLAPSITNGPPPTTTPLNTFFNFTYTTSGYPQPTFTVTPGSLPKGVTLTSDGIMVGTPTKAGVYTGTVTASNGVGTPATQNFSITVLTTYPSWASQWFTSDQMSDPTISGPSATPENDRVPNLLKYLCNINPTEVMSPADLAALPTVGSTTISGVFYMTLTYRNNSSASDLGVTVKSSPDLQTWQTVTPDFTQTVGTDPTTGYPITQVGVNATGLRYDFISLGLTLP